MPAVGQSQADGIPKPRADFLRTDGKLIKFPDPVETAAAQ
jgi:hypothetical protein